MRPVLATLQSPSHTLPPIHHHPPPTISSLSAPLVVYNLLWQPPYHCHNTNATTYLPTTPVYPVHAPPSSLVHARRVPTSKTTATWCNCVPVYRATSIPSPQHLLTRSNCGAVPYLNHPWRHGGREEEREGYTGR